MYVAFEFGRPNFEFELFVEKLDETVNEVIGSGIALVNQRIMAAERLHAASLSFQPGEVRIILPQRWAGGSHVREEPSGIGAMQIADGRGQHDDVARRQKI